MESILAETATGLEPTASAEAPASTDARRDAGELEHVRRPGRRLLYYYMLQSLATGPVLLVLLPLRYFRYRTLHYAFDDEGVTMRWGLLFRREITLTYARIQDIHLVSNVLERWLGIGRIQVQTASGKSGAEMTIEGLPDYEAVRDRLYGRMRGAREVGRRIDRDGSIRRAGSAATPNAGEAGLGDVVTALEAAVAELRALRAELPREQQRP